MRNNKIPHVSIEIKPSKVASGGVGIFAVHNFKKRDIIGKAICYSPGVFLSWNDVHKLNTTVQHMIAKFCIGNTEGVWTPLDFNFLPAIWYINHNCDYNVGFDEHDNFIAVRDILEGEELCLDFGFAISNPDYFMRCTCGLEICRKKITGNDWMQFITDERKRKYMLSRLKVHFPSNQSD